jgi:Uncharacterised conserved protein
MDLIDNYSSDEATEGEVHEPNQTLSVPRGCVRVIPSDKIPSDTFERSIPHIRGNWAGHVFLSLNEDDLAGEWKEHAISATERLRTGLEKLGWSGTVVAHRQLHVSLSRPFFLQLGSIESFHRELQQALSHERALVLQTEKEMILSNEEGTRSFLTWKLVDNQTLRRIVVQIDAVMLKYKQQVYYNPPIFHVSLASLPGKLTAKDIESLQNNGNAEFHDSLFVCTRNISCTFGTTKRLGIVLLP